MQPNINDNNTPNGNDKENETKQSKAEKISSGVKNAGKGCWKFIWDGEKREFCGRGARRWLEITIFYIIFYACLAAFYAGMVSFYYAAMQSLIPFLTGTDSILKNNPGLMFYPTIHLKSSVVRAKNDAGHLSRVMKDFDKVLKIYKRKGSEHYCLMAGGLFSEYGSESGPNTQTLPCDVSPEPPDDCALDYHGYSTGSPCVLLKLNRIYDFKPRNIQNLYDLEKLSDEEKDADQKKHRDQFKNNLPPGVIGRLPNGRIHVKCFAETKATADNMGDIDYYYYQGDADSKPVKAKDSSGDDFPPNVAGGYPVQFYPYQNQRNYRSPLVWVRFKCPTSYVPLMITCKAFAHNIFINDDGQPGAQSGMVHFELLNEEATQRC